MHKAASSALALVLLALSPGIANACGDPFAGASFGTRLFISAVALTALASPLLAAAHLVIWYRWRSRVALGRLSDRERWLAMGPFMIPALGVLGYALIWLVSLSPLGGYGLPVQAGARLLPLCFLAGPLTMPFALVRMSKWAKLREES